jgi:BirA family biotin operon repressor/biotin-[acetyl-CoA-carboxylase] ligase
VPSSWSDLDRPPLSARRLNNALAQEGALWHAIRVVDVTGSTNADVVAEARAGAAEGLVVIAERQDGGRGRLDRAWESPPRAGLLLSALLRPSASPSWLPLVPLLAGTAAVETVRAVSRVDAWLKWPNDVLVGGRKLGGILVERVEDAVVVGFGLNISTRADELPVPTATSLALEGGETDREPLAKELLRALARRYAEFERGGAAAVVPAYREVCDTIGREVRLLLPGGDEIAGLAIAVDDAGRLVVRDGSGNEHAWSAGDVVHARQQDGGTMRR